MNDALSYAKQCCLVGLRRAGLILPILSVLLVYHAYGGPGAKDAIRAGVRSIEHGFFLDDEALDMMVARGTFWVPTISVYIPDRPREAWSELQKTIIDSHARTIRRAAEKGHSTGVEESGSRRWLFFSDSRSCMVFPSVAQGVVT